MAKVAMMTDGLRPKPTYEEIIDYIENDPDKVKYPNRAAKLIRNTFQLSQLDGVGQALLEQQEAEAMKEKVKDYQLQQLAIQNDTDVKRQRAIQQGSTSPVIQESTQAQPHIQTGGSSSSGILRHVAGGVVSGVGTIARGIVSVMNPFGSHASPVPSEMEESIADYEEEQISKKMSEETRKSQKTASSRSSVRDDLELVHQQLAGVLLPIAGGIGGSPLSNSPSSQHSSVPPTQFYNIATGSSSSQQQPISVHGSSSASSQQQPIYVHNSSSASSRQPVSVRGSPSHPSPSPENVNNSPKEKKAISISSGSS